MIRSFVAMLMLLAIGGRADAEVRRALLVGVNDYRNPMDNLKGALNDVNAMESILKVRFGFQDIVLLKDRDATHDRILDELRALVFTRSKPGDVALFYFSGHGSQKQNLASPEADKMDETIVPHPWPRRQDIRDKELGTILEAAARRGIQVIAMIDSCHSASMGRGIGSYGHPKLLIPDTSPPAADASRPDAAAAGALLVAASQTDQVADEVRDENGTFGGAFTLALVKVMREAPVDESVSDVFFRTSAILRSDGRSQEPSVDASVERSREPLFGPGLHGTGVKLAIASSGTESSMVVLEGGIAVGLAPGSILVRRAADGPKLTIRVATADLTRSRAKVIEGGLATVRAGQLFDVTKWTVPLGAALRVHIPVSRPQADVLVAAARLEPLRASTRLAIVDDPAMFRPSHVLVAGSRQWSLRGPDGREVELGASPDAKLIEKALAGVGGIVGWPSPCDTRPCLYIRLPPSAEVVAHTNVGKTAEDAIHAVPEADAHYILAGRARGGRLEYAWVLAVAHSVAGETAAERSPLPPRSRWIEADLDRLEVTGGALEESLLKIARIRDWLQMPSPADTGRFPYRLVLRKTGAAGVVGADEVRAGAVLTVGEHYDLYLRADADRLKRPDRVTQNVYILALDGAGAIKILFPRDQSVGPTETRYPIVDPGMEWPALTRVGTTGFTVGCPVGKETYILVKSTETLPNLRDVEQDAVTKSRRFGNTTGLERLLLTVGKRSRSTSPDPLAVTDPEWSIERLEIESREGTSPCPASGP